ncbi:MAG TPA: DUF1080 domain-containing protein [Candidatus Marinimicrobia bacterium]|nr:DUF1080 domain-containing protein [Candidatus Neomarinimicrobiota bacterium]HJM84880.1 DUF1080 domain-containing protein [Candidatus Neomarinimicrobiota bacterium]
MITKIIYLLSLCLFIGCSFEKDWIVLFDGKSVQGLRGYKQSGFPKQSWIVVDGTLKSIPENGIDLISEDIFEDFELELEWKVEEGGNSGIFYFATEKSVEIWHSAPEMQVLDNTFHNNGKKSKTSAGALYDLIEPVVENTKPTGEYNHVVIIAKDKHVEHWLNGIKILEYDYQSSEMWKLVDKSKFKDMPFFAKAAKGFIGLQGDHGEVWYRKIRIRNL